MSVDLAVWYEPTAVTHERAAEVYERLRRGQDAGLTGHLNLSTFLADLVHQFPTGAGRRVWSVAPEVEDNGLLLSLSRASARELAPKIRYMAERYGLVTYDPRAGRVQLPRPLVSPLLLLSGDGLPSVIEPSADELTRIVGRLGEEHDYLTLQRFGEQYVQAALRTTSNSFAVEYRDGAADQHFQVNTRDLEVVTDVFVGFVSDAEEWKDRYRWRRWA